MKTRAVIYARVSSDGQRDRHTIDAQLSALPAFVEAQGWELVRPADTYKDDGFSAAADKLDARLGLQALLRDARAGEFDIVAVVDIDRLTRSDKLDERGAILGALQRAGVKIAELHTGQVHDLDSFQGDLVAGLRAMLAAEARRQFEMRSAAGKDRAIAAGRKPGGVTPYGLRYDRQTGAFAVCEAEAAIVREVYARLAAGESTGQIEADLNARGVPTGHTRRRNRAAMWWRERVYQIATSTAYRGEWLVDHRNRRTIPVPRIVADDLWYRVQDALSRGRTRGLRRTKGVYLCEGRAVCALCGSPIGIHGCAPTRKYYRCMSQARGQAERCSLPYLRTDVIDRRLWLSVEELLGKRWDELCALVARQQQSAAASATDWAGDVAEYERRLAQLEAAKGSLVAQLAKGRLSPASLDAGLDQIETKQAAYHTQLEAARRALAAGTGAPDVLADLARLRGLLPITDAVARRDLVKTLIPGRDGLRVVLGPGQDGPGTASERATVDATAGIGDVGLVSVSRTDSASETHAAVVAVHIVA